MADAFEWQADQEAEKRCERQPLSSELRALLDFVMATLAPVEPVLEHRDHDLHAA